MDDLRELIKDALNSRSKWGDYIKGIKKPTEILSRILKKRVAIDINYYYNFKVI